jgi:hypothetical protein
MIITTYTNPKMEMGDHIHVFHHRNTNISQVE